MRSRLWSLILRELPFPFRQIGMEIAHVLRWLDHGAAKIWLGLHNSPGWYVVTLAGSLTLLLTTLLFFPYIASHDPTLGALATEGETAVRVTRASLEASGDWSTQDRWRVAHLFVDHRPPRKHSVARLDSRLKEATATLAAQPASRSARRRSTDRRFDVDRNRMQDTELLPVSHSATRRTTGKPVLGRLDPEVRLELKSPGRATQTPRLVYDQLVRNPGADYDSTPASSRYRTRDKRLLVQAEWAFDRDCNNGYEPPRNPLSRRVIPVPEPQWDEPRATPSPRRERRPDLAFELELLREHLPSVGEFPPRSRSTSVAAHSEFAPATDRLRRSTRLAAHNDHWLRSTSHVEHRPPPEAYISRVDHHVSGPESVPFSDIEDDDHKLASFAEVALRIELDAPHTAITGQQHESSLRIHNDGSTAVSLVRVRESLDELQTVTDANPAARLHHDQLERDLINLQPGRERRLGVTWLPNDEGSRIHRAAVIAHAAVGVTTQVVAPEPVENPEPAPPVRPPAPLPRVEPMSQVEIEPPRKRHPAVTCEVKHRDRIAVDESVELEIVVRNTGETALNGVRILVEVPAELKHRQGAEVEYEIGALAQHGTHKAVMKLLAVSEGKAVGRIHVTSDEAAESTARATIAVVPKPMSPPPSPLPNAVRHAPAPATKPRPNPVSDGCCCPSLPVACIWNPWTNP